MKTLFLSLTLLLSPIASAATDEIDSLEWQLKKANGNIKVLSAEVPDSPYRAYLATTVIDANTDDLIEIIIYTSSRMPFPLKDRDTLAPKEGNIRIVNATVIWELTP